MFALVNCLFGFPLGKIKRNGIVGSKPKYYQTSQELAIAYSKLSPLQRTVIAPAMLQGDTYTMIEFR